MSIAFLERAADLLDGHDAGARQRDELAQARSRLIEQCPTPAHLAARFDPTFVRTQAVDLVAARLRETVAQRDGRLVVSVPPQEMKTTLLRWLGLWLLAEDPDRRVVYASYAASLARTSGRVVRSLVLTHGAPYGLALDRGHADASDWELAEHSGGMVTTGVGGALTGRPADLLIIDDPIRNQQDADSTTVRENLHDWWSSVALTRLAPGAPVIVVQTRWHEDDLAGRRIAEGWPVLNIPALAMAPNAEKGIEPDALGRRPGEWLVSARGRTVADWEGKRAAVGERTFAALYQGQPAPVEGGVFRGAWFDTWRLDAAPAGCLPPVVVVDPADNEGSGDEAGIIVAAQHPDGRVFILDDLSAPMTVARWARTALLVCVRRDAPTLAYEQSLSQLPARIREAWAELHQQALALVHGRGPAGALDRLSRPDDPAERRALITAQLAELTPADAQAIVGIGTSGPRLRTITAKGSKETRMQWAAPLFETGRAVMVGRHPQLEHQASTWQPGQDSPDRVDAMVHACGLDRDARPRMRWLG